MGNTDKKMDHVFREKLDNIKIKAPDDIWTNIENQLILQSKSKRIIPIRYIAAASIAIIAVSATLFSLYKLNNSFIIDENNVSELNQKIENNNVITKETIQPVAATVQSSNRSIASVFNPVNNLKTEIVSDKADSDKDIALSISDNKLIKLKNKAITMLVSKNSLTIKEFDYKQHQKSTQQNSTDLLALNTNSKIRNRDKWSVGIDFAPSYSYRHLSSSGNQESVAYFNTVENPVKTFSGGVNIQYKALKRLTIQTGIYYAKMGQSIGNMTIYDNKSYDNAAPAYKENYLSSITLTNSVGNININSKYVFVDQTNIRVNTSSDSKFFFDPNDPSLNPLESKVQQNFEYIDVPLLFRYKLIDKKIDLNLTAGMSASFLVGNQVYLIINETETNIGETKSIRETNYTGNLGFGIELPLANKLVFRLEPGFKYYINAINTDTEIKSHPYSISIFSGFCLSL